MPANTFIATAEAVSLAGAELGAGRLRPVDAGDLRSGGRGGAPAPRGGGRHRGPPLRPPGGHRRAPRRSCDRYGAWVVEDACQAHLARARGIRAGGLGRLGCFSFYPSKNLGATGEGGAVTTNDAALAAAVRELRHHGQAAPHRHERIGCNARMGELVAAALRDQAAPTGRLDGRRAGASPRATASASPRPARSGCRARSPGPSRSGTSTPSRSRSATAVRAALHERGIATGVHYPTPIHLQPAYAQLGHGRGRVSGGRAELRPRALAADVPGADARGRGSRRRRAARCVEGGW